MILELLNIDKISLVYTFFRIPRVITILTRYGTSLTSISKVQESTVAAVLLLAAWLVRDGEKTKNASPMPFTCRR